MPFDVERTGAGNVMPVQRGGQPADAGARAANAVQPKRSVITADITINGRHIGEYAEALID